MSVSTYAFGDDVYAICELPDDETASAIEPAHHASGADTVKTFKLLSQEEIDSACVPVARADGAT